MEKLGPRLNSSPTAMLAPTPADPCEEDKPKSDDDTANRKQQRVSPPGRRRLPADSLLTTRQHVDYPANDASRAT
ncbi:hypothetical protein, partial [Streptomyces sp. NPDC057545]|uniref:hypothetical protein n=1 Tax=Streptomyces sp. NPDC057545 TaxID=3346164 RepID=UPI0036C96FAC